MYTNTMVGKAYQFVGLCFLYFIFILDPLTACIGVHICGRIFKNASLGYLYIHGSNIKDHAFDV